MANPFIAVRITPDLDAAIVKRIQETGQSKSDVVIEALKTYLGILPQAHRLAEIEQRLSALEATVDNPDESSDPSSHHLSP